MWVIRNEKSVNLASVLSITQIGSKVVFLGNSGLSEHFNFETEKDAAGFKETIDGLMKKKNMLEMR